MTTPEYRNLRSRLLYLQSTLPDASVAKTALSRLQLDQMAAFALMSHAACEQFIEDRCLQLADNAIEKFKVSGYLGRVAKHLCVFPFVDVPKDQGDFKKLNAVVGCAGFGIMVSPTFKAASASQITDILMVGYKRYKRAISSNHGISIKYQLKLMGMIGLDRTAFDPTFASRLTQLAQLRGEAAHKSVVAVTIIPEPRDVSIWTNDLVAGFKQLDLQLTRLGKTTK